MLLAIWAMRCCLPYMTEMSPRSFLRRPMFRQRHNAINNGIPRLGINSAVLVYSSLCDLFTLYRWEEATAALLPHRPNLGSLRVLAAALQRFVSVEGVSNWIAIKEAGRQAGM